MGKGFVSMTGSFDDFGSHKRQFNQVIFDTVIDYHKRGKTLKPVIKKESDLNGFENNKPSFIGNIIDWLFGK